MILLSSYGKTNRKLMVFCPYRIASGAYYEAHQQLRVIAVRYIKQSNYEAAADLLAGGAAELLRAGSQQGASASGGDLAIMLVVEVYNKAEWEIAGGDGDAEGRARKSEFQPLPVSPESEHHHSISVYGCSIQKIRGYQDPSCVLFIYDKTC